MHRAWEQALEWDPLPVHVAFKQLSVCVVDLNSSG
jgi:hypothetical protein